MDYNNMSYEELVEQLKKHFLFMNITKVKEFFIESSDEICKLQDILLEKNKEYFDKHFREE
jgi:hypothetical protein